MTTSWMPPRKDFFTIVGTVTRTLWLDSSGLAGSPRVRVTVIDGRELAHVEMRVLKKGIKYRTEWLDGCPIRIHDGFNTWNFFYHPSDYGYVPGPVVPVKSSDSDHAPFFYELPPRPAEDAGQGLEPLSIRMLDYGGRQVVEVIRPVSLGRPLQRGYRHLFDPETGFLVRSSYGGDETQVVEWRDLHVDLDLDDGLFTWPGPVRAGSVKPKVRARDRADQSDPVSTAESPMH